MRPLCFLAVSLALLLLAGCDLFSGSSIGGITHTSEDGTILGPTDPDDWRPVGSLGEGGLRASAASPNPALQNTLVVVEVGRPQHVRATLLDDDLDPIGVLLDEVVPKRAVVTVRRPASAPGLYRLEVEAEVGSTYGDIEFE